MHVLSAGLSVALATSIATSGIRKFWADAATERLRDRLQLGTSLWRITGGLELCAAIGLFVGLSSRSLGVAAAIVVTLVMVGALLVHIRVGVGGGALMPPLVVLVAGVLTAAAQIAAP